MAISTLDPKTALLVIDLQKGILADSMTTPEVKAQIVDAMGKMAISPQAIARAIAFSIEQPADVDPGEIVVRPTAQG